MEGKKPFFPPTKLKNTSTNDATSNNKAKKIPLPAFLLKPRDSGITKTTEATPASKPAPSFLLLKPRDSGVTRTTKATSASKPASKHAPASASNSTPDAQYYTKDGLHIPLCDARGKRLTHARDGRVITHKSNRKTILDDIVRTYAGAAMVERMEKEKWSKEAIGDWITDVETRAFGNPPKSKTMKERAEEKKAEEKRGAGDGSGYKRSAAGVSSKKTPAAKGPAVGQPGPRRISRDVSTGYEEPQGRVTRSMSEEIMSILAVESPPTETAPVPLPTVKAPPRQLSLKLVSAKPEPVHTNSDPAVIVSLSNAAGSKRPAPAAESPQQTKKLKTDDTTPAPAPAPLPSQSPPLSTLPIQPQAHPQPMVRPPNKPQPVEPVRPKESFPWNHANDDLYLPNIRDLHTRDPHPYIPLTGLDPTWEPTGRRLQSTPVRVLPLPGPEQHLILASTSHLVTPNHATTSLHALLIPHRDVISQRKANSHGNSGLGSRVPPPHRKKVKGEFVAKPPTFREGKHGWDYERHRWSWEGHESLLTGEGHRVDPEDQRMVDEGVLSVEAFRRKYPGMLGSQWPCGCQIPGEWDDSEAE